MVASIRLVLVGEQRLAMQPWRALAVPQEVANLRRHRAQIQSGSQAQPSANRVVSLCGCRTFFLTNVKATVWPASVLAKIYRLRWRVEIIFKAWKVLSRLAPNELPHRRLCCACRFSANYWFCAFAGGMLCPPGSTLFHPVPCEFTQAGTPLWPIFSRSWCWPPPDQAAEEVASNSACGATSFYEIRS